MADCPRCKVTLTVRQATPPGQKESLDVDCCDSCGGVFVDGAELSRASRALGALFGERRQLVLEVRPSGLSCPRCRSPLGEVGVNDVAVDWCQTCFGVWLDGGEYQAVNAPKRRAPPTTATCYVCERTVPLGETYYTDEGMVCSGCRGEEMKAMKEREGRLQEAYRRYQQAQADAERQAAAARIQQLRSDLSGATSADLAMLRAAVGRGW